ncbi:MAG: tRNA pseudouridine(13) synthase TruD [Hahellaceae bacterium]|nr:tRNA pseudouridine(13) synthase TruD [Hahellaceae bacterium]
MNALPEDTMPLMEPDYHALPLWEERFSASWKAVPEDFRVDELADFERDPKGEQVLLQVSKRGQNTHWVAREIARFAGVRDFDVAYCGLKDRQAVTRQWMSVYLGARPEPDWSQCRLPEVQILPVGRTRRKLRRGDHAGNRFKIVITMEALEHEAENQPRRAEIDRRLTVLKRDGYPNAFGPQRFGREDDNVRRALTWLKHGTRMKNRHLQGVYLSAIRAAFFNAVLNARLRQGNWNQLLTGDVPVAAAAAELGWGGLSACLVPSGVLPGDARFGEGEKGKLEEQIMAPFQEVLAQLHRLGVRGQNRPLVARCQALDWEWEGMSRLTLSITLGKGCYASSLLEQIFILDSEGEESDDDH